MNDLFRSSVNWKCVQTDAISSGNSRKLKLRLKNRQLMNLALGHALDAPVPQHYRLGFQNNCSNLEMSMVIYDTTTMETVLTLADVPTTSYRSNGKVARVISSGSIRTNGFLLGGQLTAQLVLRLDHDYCARKATVSAAGTMEVQTDGGPVTMNLERAKLQAVLPATAACGDNRLWELWPRDYNWVGPRSGPGASSPQGRSGIRRS